MSALPVWKYSLMLELIHPVWNYSQMSRLICPGCFLLTWSSSDGSSHLWGSRKSRGRAESQTPARMQSHSGQGTSEAACPVWGSHGIDQLHPGNSSARGRGASGARWLPLIVSQLLKWNKWDRDVVLCLSDIAAGFNSHRPAQCLCIAAPWPAFTMSFKKKKKKKLFHALFFCP